MCRNFSGIWYNNPGGKRLRTSDLYVLGSKPYFPFISKEIDNTYFYLKASGACHLIFSWQAPLALLGPESHSCFQVHAMVYNLNAARQLNSLFGVELASNTPTCVDLNAWRGVEVHAK